MIILYQVYQIKSGETIESIAKKLNTTSDELRRLNGIGDNATIREGSYIIIPNNNNDINFNYTDPNYKKYIVQKGDNMYKIARENNIDYNTLLKLNGLKNDEYIYPNQEIIIPLKNTYVTSENEKISDIMNKLNLKMSDIEDLYVVEDQVINY
ncbi:MAG: LysM peptidoglycan-binding domain-containing protein [Lactobacillales bacterium]|nr:LysM peptidoglycan-binding domain-containing protein [Lactobacillales bacterium]